MDKYHIYEEVGAGQHSQVFKGREKMDIEYVAIKRVEKSMMERVIKEVQARRGGRKRRDRRVYRAAVYDIIRYDIPTGVIVRRL